MLLCHFNPEHDYAIANGDENYVAPASALQFAQDCRNLLSMAYPGSVSEYVQSVTKVKVWGWNPAVRKQLGRQGVPMELMPTDQQLRDLRELTHRKTSAYAMTWLKSRIDLRPRPATIITDMEQADGVVMNSNGPMLLKWPYSSNGTGVILIQKPADWMDMAAREQCRKQLKHYGSVMAEPMYDVVLNFAMEFECSGGMAQFCGYSLFQTDGFSYSANLLKSDSQIEDILQCYIDRDQLHAVRCELQDFLTEFVAKRYEGIVGVDMFVYSEEGCYWLNPAVELNFRHTMGWLARRLYDLGLVPKDARRMMIDRSNSHYSLLFD